jgi:hypothetical protein
MGRSSVSKVDNVRASRDIARIGLRRKTSEAHLLTIGRALTGLAAFQ